MGLQPLVCTMLFFRQILFVIVTTVLSVLRLCFMCLSQQVCAGAAAGLPQPLCLAHGDPLAPDEAAELAGVLARLRLPVVPGGVDRDTGLQGPGQPAGRPPALDGVGGLGLQP